jgi:hypothetical protein
MGTYNEKPKFSAYSLHSEIVVIRTTNLVHFLIRNPVLMTTILEERELSLVLSENQL